jgi:hypothetical protein
MQVRLLHLDRERPALTRSIPGLMVLVLPLPLLLWPCLARRSTILALGEVVLAMGEGSMLLSRPPARACRESHKPARSGMALA